MSRTSNPIRDRAKVLVRKGMLATDAVAQATEELTSKPVEEIKATVDTSTPAETPKKVSKAKSPKTKKASAKKGAK